jgi:hypothetical protein
MSLINGDGGLDVVYIRNKPEDINILQYNINNDAMWIDLVPPYSIENTSLVPTSNVLKIMFPSTLILTSSDQYFICASDGIQFGNTYLDNSGNISHVLVRNVVNFKGFLNNGYQNRSGYNYIFVYNTEIRSENSTLEENSGWIGQAYYGKDSNNNHIINCISNGNIPSGGGGILGAYAGTDDDLFIVGCHSYGTIAELAGGIVGQYGAYLGGSLAIDQSSSDGDIGYNGGGIVGQYGAVNGKITVTKCYSMGNIGSSGGGIFGGSCGNNGGAATATQCYSRGLIGESAGGIFGYGAGNNGAISVVKNSYSTGFISTATSGGIFGNNFVYAAVDYCYTSGASLTNQGYIYGGVDTVGSLNYSEAANGGSGWNSTHANTVLTGFPVGGAGESWVELAPNTPYELFNFGYTPYEVTNIINSVEFDQEYAETVEVYNFSKIAIRDDYFYSIISANNEDPKKFKISINEKTGQLRIDLKTPPNFYTLVIRAKDGSYSNTVFYLTVFRPPPPPECCISIDQASISYDVRSELLSGKEIYNNIKIDANLKFYSYEEYMRYKKATTFKRLQL